MRVNVDEQVFNEPRFRRLARLMSWPHVDFAIGAVTRLWMVALNRVTSDNPDGLLGEDDAEDSTDHRGLIAAMVECGLAEHREGGLLYFAGVRERASWVAAKKHAASLGGKARAEQAKRAGGKFTSEHQAADQPHAGDVTSHQLVNPPGKNQPSGSGSGSGSGSSSGSGSVRFALEHPEPGKTKPLDPHRKDAEHLWARQEELRAKTIPGARPLKPTDDRLDRVVERLDENSVEDCEHVLEVYAAEARAGAEGARWFNGETNWRKENFDRALGQALPAARAPAPAVLSQPIHPDAALYMQGNRWADTHNLAGLEERFEREGIPMPWLEHPSRLRMRVDAGGHPLKPVRAPLKAVPPPQGGERA